MVQVPILAGAGGRPALRGLPCHRTGELHCSSRGPNPTRCHREATLPPVRVPSIVCKWQWSLRPCCAKPWRPSLSLAALFSSVNCRAVCEIDVNLQRNDSVADQCRAHGMQGMALSPLCGGRALGAEHVAFCCKELEKSPAQVTIRWLLQVLRH